MANKNEIITMSIENIKAINNDSISLIKQCLSLLPKDMKELRKVNILSKLNALIDNAKRIENTTNLLKDNVNELVNNSKKLLNIDICNCDLIVIKKQ